MDALAKAIEERNKLIKRGKYKRNTVVAQRPKAMDYSFERMAAETKKYYDFERKAAEIKRRAARINKIINK